MNDLAYLDHFLNLPLPFDRERAARGRNDWIALEADLRTRQPQVANFVRQLGKSPKGLAILDAVFGNSPFLGQLLLGEPEFLRRFFTEGPDRAMAGILADVAAAAGAAKTADDLMRPLRLAKRRAALGIALADLGQLWTLAQITHALSDLADACVDAALSRLWRDAAAKAKTGSPPAALRDSGFCVLALGKLGGRELNYSSDIDLIVLWDQEKVTARIARDPQEHFVRLTASLVKLLQERTSDGYVFRVDLRLRPDAGATPIAISMAAAENYYESLGQNWERAALIKARPIAGDLKAGQDFLDLIGPFIWRKHLDFAAIDDIHSIKRQIHAHKGHADVTVAGHNIKLGRGGIREIEFFAQTQQLIAGGRDKRLQTAATCDSLRALAATGRLDGQVADELIGAYEYLRRVEHRLQMIADEQAHTLPRAAGELLHLAVFLGLPKAQTFVGQLTKVLKTVERHYANLFERAPPLSSSGNLVFTGAEDDPETLKSLQSLGFQDPANVAAIIRGWHHGRYRAMRSERARETLTAIMPKLLEALAATSDPDTAFLRFDEFLGRLPTGIQLFSLFYANPGLLQITAEIMGTAPRLAAYLAHRPLAFDSLLAANFASPLAGADKLRMELGSELRASGDFQEVLDGARRWVGERKLKVGIQLLLRAIDGEAAGLALADLAEAALGALLPEVERDFAHRHGRIKGGAMAILALGRLGGREMTLESDLDLIFVYDHPKGEQASTGRAALSPGQYFARLSQGMINALTAPTAEGRLYDVDMRLRPSGNSGPIAVGIEGFRRYQTTEAWAWEHLALTRARVVAGPAPLCRRIEKIVASTLTMSRDWQKLRTEVVEMRQRIAQEHPASHPWSVKHVRGGLVDIEFIAQCLQLRHAARFPAILSTHTLEALDRMRRAGVLERKTAADLQAAARLEGDILQLTRLCQSEAFEAQSAPSGIKTALARMAKAASFETLESRLQAAETRTLEIYRALIEHDAADDTSRPKIQSTAKAKSKQRARSTGKQQPAPSSPTFSEKSPMSRTLSAGDAAPDFDLPTDTVGPVSLRRFRKQTLVLYFYPKDDTTGCTKEAIDFSALTRAFAKAGAVVLGCSRDTVAAHAKFRKKHKLKILLASDADGRSSETYGVWVEKSMYGRKYMGIERSTFLIDRQGRIAKIWRKVKTAGHAEEVLSEIKKL